MGTTVHIRSNCPKCSFLGSWISSPKNALHVTAVTWARIRVRNRIVVACVDFFETGTILKKCGTGYPLFLYNTSTPGKCWLIAESALRSKLLRTNIALTQILSHCCYTDTFTLLDIIRLSWCRVGPRVESEDICFHILEIEFNQRTAANARNTFGSDEQNANREQSIASKCYTNLNMGRLLQWIPLNLNYESESVESRNDFWKEASSQIDEAAALPDSKLWLQESKMFTRWLILLYRQENLYCLKHRKSSRISRCNEDVNLLSYPFQGDSNLLLILAHTRDFGPIQLSGVIRRSETRIRAADEFRFGPSFKGILAVPAHQSAPENAVALSR